MSHLAHGGLNAAAEEADVARRTTVGGDYNREPEGRIADGSSGSGAPSALVPGAQVPQNRSGRPLDPLNANEKQTQTTQSPTAHADFCLKLGIDQANPSKSTEGGFYREIKRACKYHNCQYWLVASTINTFYLSQIVIGATATALGSAGVATQATLARTTAITILTAIGTVIAGVLAFLKSRGQPNRVRQLRNDLRKVKEYIREMEMAFSPPVDTTITVEDALKEVKRLYDTARENAEINYPDTWSTSPNTSRK